MTTPGRAILADGYVNKGTACSVQERRRLGFDGLLPPVVEDLKTQLLRVELECASKSTDLGGHVFLRALQDRNLVLFYPFLEQHRSANRSALARLGQPAHVDGHACRGRQHRRCVLGRWTAVPNSEHPSSGDDVVSRIIDPNGRSA